MRQKWVFLLVFLLIPVKSVDGGEFGITVDDSFDFSFSRTETHYTEEETTGSLFSEESISVRVPSGSIISVSPKNSTLIQPDEGIIVEIFFENYVFTEHNSPYPSVFEPNYFIYPDWGAQDQQLLIFDLGFGVTLEHQESETEWIVRYDRGNIRTDEFHSYMVYEKSNGVLLHYSSDSLGKMDGGVVSTVHLELTRVGYDPQTETGGSKIYGFQYAFVLVVIVCIVAFRVYLGKYRQKKGHLVLRN